MKYASGLVMAVVLLYLGCKGSSDSPASLSWQQISEKGMKRQLNIMVEQAEQADEEVLLNFSQLVKDSFQILVNYNFRKPEKIAELLLSDSKSNKNAKYDMVLASAEVMQDLNRLGLLYTNFHSALPNFNNLEVESKRFLSLNSQHGISFAPVFKRCPVMVYDSVHYPSPPVFQYGSETYIHADQNALKLSYLLEKTANRGKKSFTDSIGYLEMLEQYTGKDSNIIHLRERIVPADSIKPGTKNIFLTTPQSFAKLKTSGSLMYHEADGIPCMFSCAGILNSSNKVFAAMLMINSFLDENTQAQCYENTMHYFKPVVRIKKI